MASIFNRFNRFQRVRALATWATSSPLAQQMQTALARVPSWLLEMGALSGVEARDIARGLNDDLARLIKVCEGEQKVLGSRAARNELVMRMSLARVGGVLGPLEAALVSYHNALRRSDPHMQAIIGNYGTYSTYGRYGQPTATTIPLTDLGAAMTPFAMPNSRKAAEALRATLRDVAQGARRVQHMLGKREGSTRADLDGAIMQTRVLVDWLRRAQARFAQPETGAASA